MRACLRSRARFVFYLAKKRSEILFREMSSTHTVPYSEATVPMVTVVTTYYRIIYKFKTTTTTKIHKKDMFYCLLGPSSFKFKFQMHI